jgi:hypothetical protein
LAEVIAGLGKTTFLADIHAVRLLNHGGAKRDICGQRRTRIFRIKIDCTNRQRLMGDQRSAEIDLALDLEAGISRTAVYISARIYCSVKFLLPILIGAAVAGLSIAAAMKTPAAKAPIVHSSSSPLAMSWDIKTLIVFSIC